MKLLFSFGYNARSSLDYCTGLPVSQLLSEQGRAGVKMYRSVLIYNKLDQGIASSDGEGYFQLYGRQYGATAANIVGQNEDGSSDRTRMYKGLLCSALCVTIDQEKRELVGKKRCWARQSAPGQRTTFGTVWGIDLKSRDPGAETFLIH